MGIALDPSNGHLYWNDWNFRLTQRANLDGTGVTPIQGHTGPGLGHLALDVLGNRIYTTAGAGIRNVSRFNLDGTGGLQVIDTGFFPHGIALDLNAGRVYWGDIGIAASPTNQGIQRINLDGTGALQLISSAVFPPTNGCSGAPTHGRGRGMALDLQGGKMYFGGHPRLPDLFTCPGGLGEVWVANLDGTGLQLLVGGLEKVTDVKLDLAAGKIYWADGRANKIQRANLDGSNVQDVITNVPTPFGIALLTDIVVPVDIKATSCPNPLNVNSKGVIPVAILGTADFDATEIDVTTVTVLGVDPLRSNLEDVATPFDPFTGKSDAFDCNEDEGDGFTDITLAFDKQSVVAALGPVSDGDVVVVAVSGKLLDGTAFNGEDVIVIKKKK